MRQIADVYVYTNSFVLRIRYYLFMGGLFCVDVHFRLHDFL